MTPFARYTYLRVKNSAASEPERQILRDLQNVVCFDMDNVQELMDETVGQLMGTLHGNPTIDIAMNHGGLLVPPSENFWLEWKLPGHGNYPPNSRVGIWITSEEDSLEILTLFEVESRTFRSFIQLLPNDEFQIMLNPEHDELGGNMTLANAIAITTLKAVAGILIINAPYGIKKTTPDRHKGHVREARKAGFDLKPHHVISLDKSKAPPSDAVSCGHNGSTKAFHFVRAHRREYKPGKFTIIKAHWRGDPRLGIHRASYKVKP